MRIDIKKLSWFFWAFISLSSLFSDCVIAEVIKKGPVRPEALADVRKTVEVFNQIMTREMNIRLARDVPVYVTPDTTTYEQVLIKKFKIPKSEAKQWTDNSSGFSTDLGVAVNTSHWILEKTRDRYETAAHELFHQLQHSLLGDNWKQDPRWMREGTCYFVSNRVVERMGFQNIKSWKRSVLNSALRQSDLATAQEVIGADQSERWLALSEQKKSPHKIAILLVLALLDLSKKDPYQSIADYYTLIGKGKNFRDAFKEAFALDYDQFIQDFDQWQKERIAKPAEIEVIADTQTSAEIVGEIKKVFDSSQAFFKEHWGGPLNGSPCILIASGPAGSAEFLRKEFGLNASDSIQNNPANIFPFYVPEDIALLSVYHEAAAEESMAFTAASILARIYANETSAQSDMAGATWLFYGASDLAGVMIAEKYGNKSLKEQKESWLATVRPMIVLPHFNELQTPEECRKVAEKIGRKNLLAYIRLAACFIVEKHGFGSPAEWYRQTKEFKNPYKAFEKIFGLSQEKLEREFLAYLEQQRKNP